MSYYARAMHDPQLKKWNFQPRSAPSEYLQKAPPETFQFYREPRHASIKDDVFMNADWHKFFKAINNKRGYKLMARPIAGWFNQNNSAESITWGGNLLEILDEEEGFGRVKSFFFDKKPPDPSKYNFEQHPEIIQKFTAINEQGRIINIGAGYDAYTFIFGRGDLWVPLDTVEPLPELPLKITIEARGGLNAFNEPDGYPVNSYPAGAEVEVLAYAPRSVNVWGRTKRGWLPLLFGGSYYTSWHMQTAPPLTPKDLTEIEITPTYASILGQLEKEDPKDEESGGIDLGNVSKGDRHSTPLSYPSASGLSPLTGKGMYLWRIHRVEGGNPNAIAEMAKQAGLSHVLVKVADGRGTYNTYKVVNGQEYYNAQDGVDHVPALVTALRARGIQVWGWQYVYGEHPDLEASVAIRRVQQFDLDGFVVNAEDEYRAKGMDAAARRYMSQLRAALPHTPIALSSFRYPAYHHPFPFSTFLEYCDLNMPQVYWVKAHNPKTQLLSSLHQYQSLSPWRTYFPTGAAYGEFGWRATPQEVTAFLDGVKENRLPGANFWEWYYSRQNDGELWKPVQNYSWAGSGSEAVTDIAIRYLDALNTGDPAKVAALYEGSGVHVNAERTSQGAEAILRWYNRLLRETLPGAHFNLTGLNINDNIRTITWTAESSAGNVLDGKDSIGAKGEKIGYHYTYFTIQQN